MPKTRIVLTPTGDHVLVVARRNVDAKFNFVNSVDVRWEFHQLTRFLRRDHRWRVEVYRGASMDATDLPRREPDECWVLPDRATATSFADQVASKLRQSGTPPQPPGTH
jgi:hypothetical protein